MNFVRTHYALHISLSWVVLLHDTEWKKKWQLQLLQRKRPHWKTSDNFTCFLKEIVTFIENNYPLNNNLSNSFMSINRVSCIIDSKEVTTKKPVFYSCVFLGFGLHLLTPHCVLVAFTETKWIWLQKEESGKQTYVWLTLLKTLTLSKLRALCSLLLKLKPWLLRSGATHHVWRWVRAQGQSTG